MSQRLCVGGPVPSQIICAGKDALLRVEASIIARRYTYYCGVPRHSLSTLHSGTTASFHLPGPLDPLVGNRFGRSVVAVWQHSFR